MVRELIVPAQLAGLDVQRYYRTGEEIVSWPKIAAVNHIGIARAVIHQAKIGIDGRREPDVSASHSPRFVGGCPSLVTLFARTGNHVEMPELMTVFCVQRHHTPHVTLLMGDAREDYSIDINGR